MKDYEFIKFYKKWEYVSFRECVFRRLFERIMKEYKGIKCFVVIIIIFQVFRYFLGK